MTERKHWDGSISGCDTDFYPRPHLKMLREKEQDERYDHRRETMDLVVRKLSKFGDTCNPEVVRQCLVNALIERQMKGVKHTKEEIEVFKKFFGTTK